jgi:hypothetical protein
LFERNTAFRTAAFRGKGFGAIPRLAVVEGDACTGLGEKPDGFGADAARTPGDEGHLALQE